MHDFLEKYNNIRSIVNLTMDVDNADDYQLLELCNAAIKNNVYSVLVESSSVSVVWNWCEKSDVKICVPIYVALDKAWIKDLEEAVSNGAAEIEINSNGYSKEMFEHIASTIKRVVHHQLFIKFVLNTDKIKISDISQITNEIAKHKLVDCIKINFSNSCFEAAYINALMESLQKNGAEIGIDVYCGKLNSHDLDSYLKLFSMIFKVPISYELIRVSVTLRDFTNLWT